MATDDRFADLCAVAPLDEAALRRFYEKHGPVTSEEFRMLGNDFGDGERFMAIVKNWRVVDPRAKWRRPR